LKYIIVQACVVKVVGAIAGLGDFIENIYIIFGVGASIAI
jgi:hypothetical protein